MSDISSQSIVVSDADFIYCHSIVFINDGDHAEPDQRGEGMACIKKSPSIGEVVVSEQNLRHLDVEPLKRLFVCPHEPALADCRGCLLHGEALGVFLQA